jgi:lipoprotein signal peptidase
VLSTCSNKKLFLFGFPVFLLVGLLVKYLLVSVLKSPVVLNCTKLFNGYLSYTLVLLILFSAILITYRYVVQPKLKCVVSLSWAMILAGGLGNTYERLTFGCVKDYVNVLNLLHINIFDIMVVCGLVVIGTLVLSKNIFKGA